MNLDLLFFTVAGAFVLLLILLFSIRDYRGWIYGAFGSLFTLIPVSILLFSLISTYSEPVKLQITNYSARKGNLFFFSEEGCEAEVRYDFPVNANEESSVEFESPEGRFKKIIFVTAGDQLFTFPVPEGEKQELDIWEKELKPADDCYREQIEAYQWGQKKFSLTIGLSLFGVLLLFWLRWKKKPLPPAFK